MMEEQEALRLLGISADANQITTSQLRKHYLKAALAAHPDKNREDAHAAKRFATLQDAYSFLLDRISAGQAAKQEQAKTTEIFDIFQRAMRGENVEVELKNLGVHRPPELFGIDLAVPFNRRMPPLPPDMQDEPHLDLKEEFARAFEDQGLDEEGNPLKGWARPPIADLEDL